MCIIVWNNAQGTIDKSDWVIYIRKLIKYCRFFDQSHRQEYRKFKYVCRSDGYDTQTPVNDRWIYRVDLISEYHDFTIITKTPPIGLQNICVHQFRFVINSLGIGNKNVKFASIDSFYSRVIHDSRINSEIQIKTVSYRGILEPSMFICKMTTSETDFSFFFFQASHGDIKP